MRLSRLFTDQTLSVGESCFLDDKSSHYLSHVLRLKPAQQVIVFNGKSEHDYLAEIKKTGKKVALDIINQQPTDMESPININIFQAISKAEHLDFTLQKCTELGIKAFILFNSAHTQIPIKQAQLKKKLQHWQRITQSACEQCGRSITPSIYFYPSLEAAIPHKPHNQRLILDFNGQDIRDVLEPSMRSIDVLLGAEGGLSKEEILLANQWHFKKIKLGPRVLRTETAAVVTSCLIQSLNGDLN